MAHAADPLAMENGRWADDYTLTSGQTHYHELSHTRVWLTLLDQEWQVRYERMADSEEQDAWTQAIAWSLPGEEVPVQRFIRPDAGNQVSYLPVLASLPTVVRPYQPLTVPAQGRCIIYVGILVAMAVRVGQSRTQLLELPLAEPAMTWVGSNTMEGDLCYSAATYARLVLEAVPKRPWRAITPVTIVNHREQPLLLERFSLPTPLLSLHANGKGHLWTPGVTVTCETNMSSARLKVDNQLIPEAGTCTLISPARVLPERGSLVRAFDRLFG